MSSYLFVLVIETLALNIRKNENINGIHLGNYEHKMAMYADDITIFTKDLQSIKNVMQTIDKFSMVAGPKLSLTKTKGIWLGTLKNYGYRIFENILWTGNPVKVLGIYIGHNKQNCYELNWTKKISTMTKVANFWKNHGMTLKNRVYIIKTHLLSKIIYNLSLLHVPETIISQIKTVVFTFLWKGKRDKVKRNIVVNSEEHGGLNMTNIENFILSLKAAWVPRILSKKDKWCSLFHHVLSKLKLPKHYIWKTSFRKKDSFPQVSLFPKFYEDIIVAFNKSKYIKPFDKINKYEMIEQPIWGNEYFKVENKCLYFKQWAESGIYYVKDLIDNNGEIKSDRALYDAILNKQNVLQQLFIIKNHIMNKLKKVDVSCAKFVNIRTTPHLIHNNKIYMISDQKSKFFYTILNSRNNCRPHMESIFSRQFNMYNTPRLWQHIYNQKICNIKIAKLKEFNFKLLHNIVPCGQKLHKWKQSVDEKCFCGKYESVKHMLYECDRISELWNNVSLILKCNIQWKNIICGWPSYDITSKIEILIYISSIIAYTIFKENMFCKYNDVHFREVNIKLRVVQNLLLHWYILFEKNVINKQLYSVLLQLITENLK